MQAASNVHGSSLGSSKFLPFHCLCAAALVGAVAIAGCGSGNGGYPVSGTVKHKGQPLSSGSIAFHPENVRGQPGGAEIINGNYSIPAEQGLAPGKYKVAITSIEGGGGAVEMPGESKSTAKQIIPKEYNDETTLTAEVTEGGENKFDFDLK